MTDTFAIAAAATHRLADLDSTAAALLARASACESSVCSLRAWNDALHARSEALSLQARIELALLRQTLSERLAIAGAVPPQPR